MYRNGLVKKMVNLTFYDITAWLNKLLIHILTNIKGNETMKFGQLIECNMRNIFLQKSYTKQVEKLVPDPFLKNENLAHLLINSLTFYTD